MPQEHSEWDYPDHPDYPNYRPLKEPVSTTLKIYCAVILILRFIFICGIVYVEIRLFMLLIRFLFGLPLPAL